MCLSKPKVDTSYQDFAREEAERARAEETARQGRIATGMTSIANVFGGMQPVLDQRRQAMTDFYVPQLQQQFKTARDDLTFGLARAGQLTSSTAGQKQADLGQTFALNRANIDSTIAADQASTRGRMEQQRQALEAGLRSSGDATAASNAALSTATTFRQDAPTLNPLGHIFYGLSEGIGAARQGAATARIRALATPNPLTRGTGRVIGG
jgi:hypothetical protein